MKKRLLITSIVMMLVVAVALSTATYAWFTSNAKVEASSMTLKASTSSASALGINWTGIAAETSLTSNVFDTLKPMAPTELTIDQPDAQTPVVGTAAEDLKFYTATTKQSGGVFKFNAAGTEETPITYSDTSLSKSSFYVRNLSNANTIGTVTVTALFTADQAYTVTSDTTFQTGVKYFTRTGEEAPYTYAEATVTVGNTISDATYYEYTPYVLTKDTAITAGTKYYTKDGSKFTIVENPVVGSIGTYYEKISADDMIRLAIFTQEYRQTASNATKTSADQKFYYYNTANVIAEKEGLSVGDSVAGLFTLSSDKHLLKGVLGNKERTFTLEGVNDTYDMNKVYYTESNNVYTKVAVTDASDYATKKGSGLYTCDRETAYGSIAANGAVNALSYYTDVVNSMTIASALKPNEQIDIVVYAWLDGTMLDDSRTGELGNVSLLFSAN